LESNRNRRPEPAHQTNSTLDLDWHWLTVRPHLALTPPHSLPCLQALYYRFANTLLPSSKAPNDHDPKILGTSSHPSAPSLTSGSLEVDRASRRLKKHESTPPNTKNQLRSTTVSTPQAEQGAIELRATRTTGTLITTADYHHGNRLIRLSYPSYPYLALSHQILVLPFPLSHHTSPSFTA
jgi:hypothetical protein